MSKTSWILSPDSLLKLEKRTMNFQVFTTDTYTLAENGYSGILRFNALSNKLNSSLTFENPQDREMWKVNKSNILLKLNWEFPWKYKIPEPSIKDLWNSLANSDISVNLVTVKRVNSLEELVGKFTEKEILEYMRKETLKSLDGFRGDTPNIGNNWFKTEDVL